MKPAIMQALFDQLPDDGQPFDPFAREHWTKALIAVLEVAYPRHVSTRPAATPAPAPAEPTAAASPEQLLVTCPLCGKQLKPGGLVLHKLRKHNDHPALETAAEPAAPITAPAETQEAGPHRCHICFLTLSSAEAIRSHIHSTHNLEPIPAPPIERNGFDIAAARARAAAAI